MSETGPAPTVSPTVEVCPSVGPAAALAIEARSITKAFGTRKALDRVSFELPAGAFLSIFGPNGAGKTTLMRTLATLSTPTSGSATVLGYDLKEQADEIRGSIGLISHNPMLYPDLSAEENLLFFASLYDVARPRERVAELLRAVELDHRRLDLVRTFSRGMSQRLSIARALLHDPRLVFLDEPYSGLDPHAIEIFDELIGRVRAGRTFVMVSHDLVKGFSVCTHAMVLARGKVVLLEERENLDYDGFAHLYHETVGMGVS